MAARRSPRQPVQRSSLAVGAWRDGGVVLGYPNVEAVGRVEFLRSGQIQTGGRTIVCEDRLPQRLGQVTFQALGVSLAFQIEIQRNDAKAPVAQLAEQVPVGERAFPDELGVLVQVGDRSVQAGAHQVPGEHAESRSSRTEMFSKIVLDRAIAREVDLLRLRPRKPPS